MFKPIHTHFWIRIVLFAVYLINGFFYIPKQSVLSDEGDHLNYAFRILKGQPQKVKPYDDASTMPISVLNTIPRVIEQVFNPGLQKNDDGASDVVHGRYITLLISLLIGIYILKWSKELYGEVASTFSLFLFVFCPNLNAHAGFVTTDAYAALFTIVPCYYFWKWHQTNTRKHLVLFSIGLGLAQLTKQSLTNLFIIFFLLEIIIQLQSKTLFNHLKQKIVRLSVVIFIALAVINAGFLFHEGLMTLGDYRFKSYAFGKLQHSLSFMKNMPLPFPSPYIYGLDLVKHMTELNPGDPRVSPGNYILGELRNNGSFWYYYFVILLFKSPLLLIIGSIMLLLFARRINYKDFINNEFVLVFTIVCFFIFFNFMVKRQAGIRHILIIFPLLYVLMGKLMLLLPRNAAFKWIMGASVIYSVSTFYFYFPNLVAYTNELVTDKKKACFIMADSNLDWGQGQLFLAKYLQANPGVRLSDGKPAAGSYILSANDYVGLGRNKNVEWLRKFRPAREVYFSYLLFNISEEDLRKNNLK